jgi:hypothetical protein
LLLVEDGEVVGLDVPEPYFGAHFSTLHPARPVGPSLSLPLAMCEADSVPSAAYALSPHRLRQQSGAGVR